MQGESDVRQKKLPHDWSLDQNSQWYLHKIDFLQEYSEQNNNWTLKKTD